MAAIPERQFGFVVLPCGCVAARYRVPRHGEQLHVEERGSDCRRHEVGGPVDAEPDRRAGATSPLADAEIRSVWP